MATLDVWAVENGRTVGLLGAGTFLVARFPAVGRVSAAQRQAAPLDRATQDTDNREPDALAVRVSISDRRNRGINYGRLACPQLQPRLRTIASTATALPIRAPVKCDSGTGTKE